MTETNPSPDPDQLRSEIEQTRAELGETVEALAAKTDVKGRAQRRVREEVETAKERVAQAASTAGDKLAEVKSTAGDKLAEAKTTAGDKLAVAKTTAGDKLAEAKSTAGDKLADVSNRPRVRRALPPVDLAVAGALAVAGTILVVRGRRA
ncbi:DUF3618 domain-containing protein [Actinoplanes oblitus]|uniref:DUF3618 domain-containing protein n=1 Tax=Actinoplanes oblitus TaxID=3040509 RepID=A0ABY8WPS0_9ACTN|nr:DUF3618 domain-containing protein [Actinoplanes oblitus]WIM99864.1 DUF3618 domain-containing protein [Actinoplanes oblitus]